MLAEGIIHYARANGNKLMVLDTMYEMKDAQALYQKLGFTSIPSYNDQDPDKVVWYGLNLTPA